MKLIVLAYTSKTYLSEKNYIPYDPIETDRADLTRKLPCMDTWVSRLKSKNIEVIFFDGDNENVTYDHKNQILHLTESDSYDYYYLHHQKKPSNMLNKLKGAIRWLLKNRDFDYILRVDDGTYVNSFVIEQYYNYIRNYDLIWSGHGGGGGMFFSKNLAEEILNINNNSQHLEDMSIFTHFSKLSEYKKGTIETMSSFYNLGENNLTIHYATGKRMYYCDFIISNYYNNLKVNRKIILNYIWDSGIELNTNRVNAQNGNTGAWYGLDRDKNNWEYYGNYARSISDIYNKPITYGKETITNLYIFNMFYDNETKIEKSLNELYDTVTKNSQFNICFYLDNDGIVLEKKLYDFIITHLKINKINYTEIEKINFKNITNAEYIKSNEIGNIIQILK